MKHATWTERLNVLVNVVILAFVLFLLFRPGGVVREEWRRWRDGVSSREAIAAAWQELSTVGAVAPGAAADRVVVEFSDYQCPACKQAHRKLPELTGRVGATVVYRHFPLTAIHPAADGAARAAICAEEQGRFAQMHDHLFSTQDWYDDPDWEKEARDVAVPDLARFRQCLDSEATSQRLARDRAYAERLGIRGTPTFVSRGGKHTGVPTADDLQRILR